MPPVRLPGQRSGSHSSSPAPSPDCRATRFAKFGGRYPSAGGLLEYVVRGFGDGHITGIIAWLILAANAIVTGMVS